MSTRDSVFYFILKQGIFAYGFKKINSKFTVLLLILLIVVISAVFSFWVVTRNKTRLISSVPQTDTFLTPDISTQPVRLDSLLIRFKTAKGFQISKLDVTLHVDSFESIMEIRQSMKQIRNHLVFILSDKDEMVFASSEKQLEIKEEIAKQLNIFLFTGQVKNIDIKQTILN